MLGGLRHQRVTYAVTVILKYREGLRQEAHVLKSNVWQLRDRTRL